MEDYLEEEDEMMIQPEQRAPELVQACKDNNTALALELISLGVPVAGHVLDKGWTALHFAALHGNEELVLALLGGGAADRYKHLKAKGMVGGAGVDHPALCNTPLQWACFHGHVNVCYFLLESGYDPDDADTLGNTCLHLAASNHQSDTVKVLLKSGADAGVQNIFSHTPLDVATDPACRELLRKATPQQATNAAVTTYISSNNSQSGSSSTNGHNNNGAMTTHLSNKESLHHQNILAFKTAQDQLEQAMLLPGTEENIQLLESYVMQGRGTVRTELLDKAKALGQQWRACIDLNEQIDRVDKAGPILTQRQYCNLVNCLEALVIKAKATGVEGSALEQANALLERSFSEYWLKKSAVPLEDVECATSKHLKDMASLEDHLKKAKATSANIDLIAKYESLLSRQRCEVMLRSALDTFPEVRLPAAEMAKDYWQAEDTGRVQETEGYPLPPEDGYKWIHSDSYIRHKKAAGLLKHAIEEADKYAAHAQTIIDAKAKDKVADGVSKILEAKDEADKAVAIAAVEKAAAKLKKGKGKKK